MSQSATPARQFARCHQLTQPCQCDWQKARNTRRPKRAAPATQNTHGSLQSSAPTKTASHLLKTSQRYCAFHTKRLLYWTRANITKCHACHTKLRCATFHTTKSGTFCGSRHIGTVQAYAIASSLWTLVDGCSNYFKQEILTFKKLQIYVNDWTVCLLHKNT